MSEGNKNQVGVQSIRLGGMSIDELPIAEAAITKQQWPHILNDARRQEVADIIAEFPKMTIGYLEDRICECEINIGRIRKLKSEQDKMINDYSAHIGLCNHRDREIAKLDPVSDKDKIKELKKEYPPYDIKQMEMQVGQCREALVRSDEVIDKEHKSISMLKETISHCRIRDLKLRPYEVTIE